MLKIRHIFFILALAGTLLLGFGASASQASGPNPVVIMETSMGRVIIMLYPKEAPITCRNFLRYVDEGFYDGTVFHRIIKMEVDEQREKKKQQAINIVQGGVGFTRCVESGLCGTIFPMRADEVRWTTLGVPWPWLVAMIRIPPNASFSSM